MFVKDYVYLGGFPEVGQYIADNLAEGKSIEEIMSTTVVADSKRKEESGYAAKKSPVLSINEPLFKKISGEEKESLLKQLREEMLNAARDLEFERAAELRDEIEKLTGSA